MPRQSIRSPVLAGVNAVTAYAALALDPMQCGFRLHRKHGPVFAIDPPLKRRERRRRGVFVASEALAEQVLQNVERFHSMGLSPVRGPRGSAQRRLRDGMIRMNGTEQHKLRRAYAPTLARGKIAAQEELLAGIVAEEVGNWPRGEVFDASAPIRRIVRRAAAAMLLDAADDPALLALADLLESHANMQADLRTILLQAPVPGLPYNRLLHHAERTEAAMIDWLGRRQHGCGGDLAGRIASVRKEDGEPLDLRAQAAQFWTLYGASFHTTSTAVSWVLLHLAWNPEASRRLAEALASEGTASPYLEAVITEMLRLSPPVPYQIRRVDEEDSVGGMDVTPGDRVFISAQVLNRDPAVYEAADCFRPERWLSMPATAYRPLAFSAGPRRCLGYTFAIAVIKATLVGLWRNGHVAVQDGARIGLRFAITQMPTRMPLILRASSERIPRSRFTGRAALQMSQDPAPDIRPPATATAAVSPQAS